MSSNGPKTGQLGRTQEGCVLSEFASQLFFVADPQSAPPKNIFGHRNSFRNEPRTPPYLSSIPLFTIVAPFPLSC